MRELENMMFHMKNILGITKESEPTWPKNSDLWLAYETGRNNGTYDICTILLQILERHCATRKEAVKALKEE